MSQRKIVSYSQYSTYRNCPRKYFYTYVKKIGGFKANEYTTFGTAMHETLQEYLELAYRKEDRNQYDMYEKLKYYLTKNNNKDHTLTPLELSTYLLKGLETLLQIHYDFKNIFPKIKEWELVSNEYEMKKVYNDLDFNQYIDVLFKKRGEDKYIIIDIKTSKFRYVVKYIDVKKKMQLHLYRETLAEQLGIPSSNIETKYLVLAVNRDIAYGKVNKYQVIDVTSVRTTDFYNFVNDIFVDGKRREDISLYPKNVTKLCDYCDLKKECNSNYLIN